MQNITNIKELRDDLLGAYSLLRADPRRAVQVGELANTAGKILNSVKLEIEYALMRKETPTLPFLEYEGRNAEKALPTTSVKKLQ